MASRGNVETSLLKDNIEGQLKRLLTQLQDIESMREDFDDEEEYTTTRQETIDQLREFEASLGKMAAGNMSLVDHIGSAQLAIQTAIRSSTTPEILNMFLKKENGALRSRLASLDSDLRLGRISPESYNRQAVDILQLLEKLKEPLSPSELDMLKKFSRNMIGYEEASGEVGSSKIMKDASRELNK